MIRGAKCHQKVLSLLLGIDACGRRLSLQAGKGRGAFICTLKNVSSEWEKLVTAGRRLECCHLPGIDVLEEGLIRAEVDHGAQSFQALDAQ